MGEQLLWDGGPASRFVLGLHPCGIAVLAQIICWRPGAPSARCLGTSARPRVCLMFNMCGSTKR